LLGVSRSEIMAFLQEEGVAYRQDSSNDTKLHLRNKIRLELLPYLKKEFNPRIDETLAQMAEILREDNCFIKEYADQALKSPFIKRQQNKITLNIDYINTLPLAILRRLLKEFLEDFSLQKNGIAFGHINSVAHLLKNMASGKVICLPFGVKARREYENLIMERTDVHPQQIEYIYPVEIPGFIYIAERNLTVNLQLVERNKVVLNVRNKYYFDLDKIRFPLILRNRRNGDWFKPLGMSGRQKLKSFFINNKITQQKRNETILMVDQQAVLWIENMQINDDVKITHETKNVLELEII
jgi:tRNA(Ile)-lysidine synthase